MVLFSLCTSVLAQNIGTQKFLPRKSQKVDTGFAERVFQHIFDGNI